VPVPIISVALLFAVLCAWTMGYAIQSGATCTVYAVTELIDYRRANRFIAMLEAGLWVALVIAAAGSLNWSSAVPPPHAIAIGTIGGGCSTWPQGRTLNGACVFGSVARFGSGEFAFVARRWAISPG